MESKSQYEPERQRSLIVLAILLNGRRSKAKMAHYNEGIPLDLYLPTYDGACDHRWKVNNIECFVLAKILVKSLSPEHHHAQTARSLSGNKDYKCPEKISILL